MNKNYTHKEVTFTGEESDRFVDFASKLLDSGITPKVKGTVLTPLTLKKVNFSGTIKEKDDVIWKSYHRKIKITCQDKSEIWIAGSNASSSYSTEKISFESVPLEFGGVSLTVEEIKELITSFSSNNNEIQSTVYQILNNISTIDEADIGKLLFEIKNIFNETTTDIQRIIVDLVVLIRDPQAIEFLKEIFFNSNTNPAIKQRISLRCRALANGLNDFDSNFKNIFKSIVFKGVEDSDVETRMYSVEALGYINLEQLKHSKEDFSNDVINILKKRKTEEQDKNVKWAISIAKGKINNAELLDILVDILHDKTVDYDRIIAASIIAISRWSDKITDKLKVQNRLIELLNHQSEYVRPFAAHALGFINNDKEHVIDKLVACINSTNDLSLISNSFSAILQIVSSSSIGKSTCSLIENCLSSILSNLETIDVKNKYLPQILEDGGDISYAIENHYLAHLFFRKRAENYDEYWEKNYFQALSLYEEGEYCCIKNPQELNKSIECFNKALELLKDDYPKTQNQVSSINDKIFYIESRIKLQTAINHLESCIHSKNFAEISVYFDEALESFEKFDLNANSTAEDKNLIKTIKFFCSIASEILKNDCKELQSLASLLSEFKRIEKCFESNRSKKIVQTLKSLQTALRQMYESLKEKQYESVFTHRDKAHKIMCQFSACLPAQECPQTTPPSAIMKINVPHNMPITADDSTKQTPIHFPLDHSLVFEITTQIFSGKNDSIVELHYGKEIRGIPILDRPHTEVFTVGRLDKSFTPISHIFSLKYKTRFGQYIDLETKTIWIKAIENNIINTETQS